MLGVAVPAAEALADIAERQEELKRQRKLADELLAREKSWSSPPGTRRKLLYAGWAAV